MHQTALRFGVSCRFRRQRGNTIFNTKRPLLGGLFVTCEPQVCSRDDLYIWSFSPLAVLKTTLRPAGILMLSPVLGLRPIFSLVARTSNVPRP
jgi:hypothetical protein